jgi:hypothetical protein
MFNLIAPKSPEGDFCGDGIMEFSSLIYNYLSVESQSPLQGI